MSKDIDFLLPIEERFRELKNELQDQKHNTPEKLSKILLKPNSDFNIVQYYFSKDKCTFYLSEGKKPPIKVELIQTELDYSTVVQNEKLTKELQDIYHNFESLGLQHTPIYQLMGHKLLANLERWADPATKLRDFFDLIILIDKVGEVPESTL